jgi:hypothetical protein
LPIFLSGTRPTNKPAADELLSELTFDLEPRLGASAEAPTVGYYI